jgi:hypothetical protein
MNTPEEARWVTTRDGIRWCLTDKGADREGAVLIRHAVRQGSLNWMGEFKDGYHICQRHTIEARSAFDWCCVQDERRVYNIGREIAGLQPI